MQDELVVATAGIGNEMLEMLRCYTASDQEEARLKAEHILSVLAPGVWDQPKPKPAKSLHKRVRSKIEPPPQQPVATCENEACPHVRRGIQHPASRHAPINFPATCKALQDPKSRPCHNKHCWSVDEAAHCAWWHGADGPRAHGLDALQLPAEREWAKNVYWMYGVVLDEGTGMDAAAFARSLSEAGVQTRPFFLGVHCQPAFVKRGLFVGESYPVTDRLARQGL